MKFDDAVSILKRSDLGAGLAEHDFNRLAAIAHEKHIVAHEQLFRQKSQAGWVYVVTEGVMVLEKISCSGRRQVVAFLFPGDFLGFTHTKWFEYNALSLTPVSLLSFDREAFVDLVTDTPGLKDNISSISNHVLSRALDQIFALGQKRADERLCFLIQQLKERSPGEDPNLIRLPMSRQDIADYLGLTMETVSRALAKLKSEEIIRDIKLSSLVIADPARLREMASLD